MENSYKQLAAWSENNTFDLKISKKGKVFLGKKNANNSNLINKDHNKKKNYILEEGMIIEPLIDLGVFTKEGKVVKSKYDKYKQINRFVEIIDDEIKKNDYKELTILDFGCGTGDISFQYLQYQPTHKVLGIDASKTGIEFATETARLSDYKTATFLEGTDHTVKQLEENSFDGVILSNVLDVMPKDVSKEVVEDLERVLKPGGYWFIKMNPYYSKEELESFGYENMGNNIYEENHIMRLRQATTNYWKERFARFGKEIIYLEFEYPWQEGMNRLFVYQS